MKASPRFLVAVLIWGTLALASAKASACVAGSTIPSVTICSPASTSTAPIHVTAAARASTNVSYMAVWLDGVKVFQNHSNSVDTFVSASAGSHRITVQAKDANGNTFAAKVYTTIGATTATTWSISGSISPASSGIAISLNGNKSASTTTSSSGTYSFTGLANGTYSVTPASVNYTFTPSSKSVTVNGASVGAIDFTANAVNSGHSVSLAWKSSTSPTVSGYKVYRANSSGGPYTVLNSAPTTSTVYSDLSVAAGVTYYYVVTAVESSGNESAYSNQTTANIPTP